MKGRPPEWKDEYIQKVDEYLALCVDEETEFHKTRNITGSNSFEQKVKVNLPKIEGFAQFIGVHKDTLYEWEKENDDFSDALNKIRLLQHNRLVDNALSGTYNPVIAKLMLSSNHGYKEKSEFSGDKENPIAVHTTIIAEATRALNEIANDEPRENN